MARSRRLLWLLLIFACAVLVLQLGFVASRYDRWLGISDFIEYWGAGQLLRHGHNPYDPGRLLTIQRQLGWEEDRPLLMWNPPWLLTLIYPLLVLPYGHAAAVWFGLSLLIILGCAAAIWQLHFPLPSTKRGPGARAIGLSWPVLAALTFAPAMLTLRVGQLSALALLGVVGFLRLERERKDLWAGAFLALLTLKPHVTYLVWLALFWWVVTRGRWRVLAGLAGTLAVLMLPLTLLRPVWSLDYVTALRQPPLYWRASVIGTALRLALGWQRDWLQYLPAMCAAALLLLALSRRQREFGWSEAVSPLLLLSIPTACYGWSFDQLVLLIPCLQVLAWVKESSHVPLLHRIGVAAGLPVISGLTLWCNANLGEDLYLVGAAVAWGLLYVVAQHRFRHPTAGTEALVRAATVQCR